MLTQLASLLRTCTTSLREAFAARSEWDAMGRADATAAAGRYRADDHLLLIS